MDTISKTQKKERLKRSLGDYSEEKERERENTYQLGRRREGEREKSSFFCAVNLPSISRKASYKWLNLLQSQTNFCFNSASQKASQKC